MTSLRERKGMHRRDSPHAAEGRPANKGEATRVRTQVGIVGGGPAGLLLSHLLHLQGIESVVLERRSREVLESEIRAGVLEQGTTDLLIETGVGDRMLEEGAVHHGINLQFAGRRRRIDLSDLTGGRGVPVYRPHQGGKDVVSTRLRAGGRVIF